MSSLGQLVVATVARAAAQMPQPPTKAGKERAKFYDMEGSVYDGHLKRPTAVYIDARQRAAFERLLRLKRSFLPTLFQTGKNRVFK